MKYDLPGKLGFTKNSLFLLSNTQYSMLHHSRPIVPLSIISNNTQPRPHENGIHNKVTVIHMFSSTCIIKIILKSDMGRIELG